MIDKKEENDFEFIYAYLRNWVYAYIEFIQNKGEGFWKFIQKGREDFREEEFLVYACFSHIVYAYIYFLSFMHFIEYLFVYCYAWV